MAPHRLVALPPEVWIRWAPVLVGFQTLNPSENDAPHQQLVAQAYRHAPEQVFRTLLDLIDAEQQRDRPSVDRVLWLIELCWDERFANGLLGKVVGEELSPFVMGQVLEVLIERQVEAAAPFALSLIPNPLPQDEVSRSRSAIAAALLLKHQTAVGWPTVWQAMQQDDGFADAVLGRFVWRDRQEESFAARLSEDAVADLYVWLSRRFPPASDPGINGIVEYRAAVGQWRDTLLTNLRLRGTREACRAIGRMKAALPDQPFLRWTLLEAKALTRQRTWVPPRPEDILALAQSVERRFVQNADQLQDLVIESLRRLEVTLQLAEPPAAIDIWDYQATSKTYRPSDEERLSDYLKRHLDNDLRNRGIVFNREVVNRRGEENDIRVEALPFPQQRDVIDPLSVIIEVKGCWHQDLMSAMKAQLVDRYLANTNTSHGLYVVGWYNCDKWDRSDPRHERAPKYDKEEAQRRLDLQAAELSTDGRRIRAIVLDTSLRH